MRYIRSIILGGLISVMMASSTAVSAQQITSRTAMAYIGTYNSATTYSKGDLVKLNGLGYVSIANSNTGNTPDVSTGFWTSIGSQGLTGIPGAPGFINGATGNFQPSPNNPITGAFSTGFIEKESDGTCRNLVAATGVVSYYTTSDTTCESWSAASYPASLQGQNYGDLYIQKSGSTYYMVACTNCGGGGAGTPSNVYALSATSLNGTWTVLNGGSPIFSTSSITTNTNYYIQNVAFMISASGSWRFWWEGGTQASPDGYLGYSYSTTCPSSCNFATNATVTNTNYFVGFYSPSITFVPDRNAIVMKAAVETNQFSGGALEVYTISSSSDTAPATQSNWTQALGSLEWNETIPTEIADARIAFAPPGAPGPWSGIQIWDNNNGKTYQGYTQLTLDQWYDAITLTSGLSFPRYANFINQSGHGDICAQVNCNLITPTITNPTINGNTVSWYSNAWIWQGTQQWVQQANNFFFNGQNGNPVNLYYFRTPLAQNSFTPTGNIANTVVIPSAAGQELSYTQADDWVEELYGCKYVAPGHQRTDVFSICPNSGSRPGVYTTLPGTFLSVTVDAAPTLSNQLTNKAYVDASIAANANPAQTTVSCSTSGTAIFSQPLQGTSDKKVLIHLSACVGTASYTYPTAFTSTPSIYASNNVAAGILTSVSASAVTVTGSTTTGSIFLEDY